MFPNSSRNLTHADNFYHRHWKPQLRRVSLPDLRFHDLRHTCATLLLTKGVHPKIVSEMLGHSTIAITLDSSTPTATLYRGCRRLPRGPWRKH